MHAPQTARTVKESGDSQYACRASPTISTKLAIPLLLRSPLIHLSAERPELGRVRRGRILEDVRHRRPAEGVHDAVDHRGHRLPIGAPLLEAVVYLLLARPPHGNARLVGRTVPRGRHACIG